jgi:hypothetical protein
MRRRISALAPGLIAALAACLALVSLAAYAAPALYSRYMADDYCTAATLLDEGLWGSQVYWYTHWSGRYAFTLAISLVHVLGPAFVPILIVAILLLWLAGVAWLIRTWARTGWSLAALLAACLLLAALGVAPNLYQSIYWITGALTYVFPLILWCGMLAILIGAGRKDVPASAAAALGYGALSFIAAGFSEVVAVSQLALLALIGGAAVWHGGADVRRRVAGLLLAGLAGTALALAVIALAPGNAIRRELLPEPAGLLAVLQASLYDVYIFSVKTVRGRPELLALAWSAGLLAGLARRAGDPAAGMQPAWMVLEVPAVTALGVLAGILPYEYAVGSYPDGRVLIVAGFILVAGLGAWGWAAGGLLADRMLPATGAPRFVRIAGGLLLGVLLAAALPHSLPATAELSSDASQFAAAWDQRDQQLRRAASRGAEELSVASLTHLGGLAEIGYDPGEWVNRCVARTYGLKRVTAK